MHINFCIYICIYVHSSYADDVEVVHTMITATHCNKLQHAATQSADCNTLQHTATR